MAATWLKPLHVNKGKTIAQTITERTDYANNPEKTIDRVIADSTGYVKNPGKTDGGELVKGYGCDPRTADDEFLLAKKEYEYLTGRDQGRHNILAYHIRQSFKPGEITPQEALDVGCELAARFTKGKHAYLAAVHTDRKHIHCHVVFNSTTLDCTGKFNNFFGSSFAVRRLSDLICAEHGLSIIENPKPSKGRNYGDWLGDNKPLSWQEKLRQKIDEILPLCSTFEDFLAAMKTAGYIVNDKRKHITFLAPEQKKPTRLDTLRGDYTEAAIRERLAGTRIVAPSGAGGQRDAEPNVRTAGTGETAQKFNLLIDIQAKIREGKGPGYEQWLRLFNLKQSAKTLLFLKEKGIDSYDDLVKKSSSASGDFNALSAKIKTADKRMAEISELQKQIGAYSKTCEVYAQYKASGWDKDFYEQFRADITLHRTAKKYFDELGLKKLPSINSLKQEYVTLLSEKKKLYSGYRAAKDNMRELLNAKHNADQMLGINKNAPERDASRGQNRNNTHEK